MWTRPHILVLDEPTNFLDYDSLGALSAAITDFKGGVVLISHHDQFTRELTREQWIIDNGALVSRDPTTTMAESNLHDATGRLSTVTTEMGRLRFEGKKGKKLTRHEVKERDVRRRLRHIEWLSSPKDTPKPEDTDDE